MMLTVGGGGGWLRRSGWVGVVGTSTGQKVTTTSAHAASARLICPRRLRQEGGRLSTVSSSIRGRSSASISWSSDDGGGSCEGWLTSGSWRSADATNYKRIARLCCRAPFTGHGSSIPKRRVGC